MSLILYDGAGKLFAYTMQNTMQGGVEVDTPIHTYDDNRIAYAWLGSSIVRDFTNDFITKLIAKGNYRNKPFPSLKFIKKLYKFCETLGLRQPNSYAATSRFNLLIHWGYEQPKIYTIGHDFIVTTKTDTFATLGFYCDEARGAFMFAKDGDVVMTKMAEQNHLLASSYVSVKLEVA